MTLRWPPGAPQRCALTIGVFDGVHRGHAAIVARCRGLARDDAVAAVAVTFDRPPEAVVDPSVAHPQLLTVARRVELLLQAGADDVVVLEFDQELAATEASAFAEQLFEAVGVAAVVVGENFRFGRGGAGDADLLGHVGADRSVAVIEEPLLVLDGVAVSSTRIRRALSEGDIPSAARWLGRPPETEGIVVPGRGHGRELGYPTINLAVDDALIIPVDGVYAGWAAWEARRAPAAISIGENPTFPGRRRSVEAHLIDVNEELLGRQVRLEFVERFRGQRRYPDPSTLAAAIAEDVAQARRLLRLVGRAARPEPPEQHG